MNEKSFSEKLEEYEEETEIGFQRKLDQDMDMDEVDDWLLMRAERAKAIREMMIRPQP